MLQEKKEGASSQATVVLDSFMFEVSCRRAQRGAFPLPIVVSMMGGGAERIRREEMVLLCDL